MNGGHVNLNKTSAIFINEFRDGTLGPISLETPDMMQKELRHVAQLLTEKAEKKAARLSAHKKGRKK